MEPARPTSAAAAPSLPEVVVRLLRHEVGDLLQTVYATAAILQEKLPRDWALERRIVGDLRTRGESCKNLLDTVHDLVCPIMLHPEPVYPGEVAAALVNAAGARHPRLQIRTEGDSVAAVTADPRRLNQLGSLLLAYACGRARKEVRFVTRPGPEPGQVEWSVADDGEPLPAEQLAQLFQPFITTRYTYETLAPALAQRIVQLHGGRIVAENPPAGGVRLAVLLPPAPPAARP
jgi:signal transduction histidine kinase